MKISIVAMFTLLIASAAAGQGLPSSSLTRGTWELGVFAGGGDGLGKSDNTQFLVAGGRGGWVLTGEHLPGILRGNFEWAMDVMPAYIVFPPNQRNLWGKFQARDLAMEFHALAKGVALFRGSRWGSFHAAQRPAR